MLNRGESYQVRFDQLAAGGVSVHGEADLLAILAPHRAQPCRVLDAGCGTGRVAIELAARGMEVTGIDVDAEMLSVARRRRPELAWRLGDLTTVQLARGAFDIVVMAGNVMIFLRPGTEPAVMANLAPSVAPGGLLVAGFQLGARDWTLVDYDGWAADAGLALEGRWSTWDRQPWQEGAGYAVSAHRKAP